MFVVQFAVYQLGPIRHVIVCKYYLCLWIPQCYVQMHMNRCDPCIGVIWIICGGVGDLTYTLNTLLESSRSTGLKVESP